MASVVEGFLIDEDFQMVLLRNSLDMKGKKHITEQIESKWNWLKRITRAPWAELY